MKYFPLHISTAISEDRFRLAKVNGNQFSVTVNANEVTATVNTNEVRPKLTLGNSVKFLSLTLAYR